MNNLICKHCNELKKSKRSLSAHQPICPKNINRVYINGMTGKKGTNHFKKAKELGLPVPSTWNKGRTDLPPRKPISDETRQKMSSAKLIKNNGGRCKWYEIDGQKVQGTWELSIAKILNLLNIKWQKVTSSLHSFEYNFSDDGAIHLYIPDFYLPEYNIYLEIKGYWWGRSYEKMQIVKNRYKDTTFIIIDKIIYNDIIKNNISIKNIIQLNT